MLGYYIVKLVSKLICVAPQWLCRWIASFLGGVAVVGVPKWRMQMAKANIMECLGVDAQRADEIAEGSVRRFGRMIVEVLRFPLLKPENIHELVKVEGLEHLEAAYKQNKGVIMATGHYGNWELLGATVALNGYPMLSIARKQNNGHMDKLINELRQQVGQKVAYNHGKSGLLAISRMLRAKNLLGILYDQETGDSRCHLKLFGKDSGIPLGAASLSRMHGCPILPIFLHNNEDGTCTAKIHPPLYAPKTKDKDQDLYCVTKQLATILEHEIINDPEMWFWVHDRWKDGRVRFGGKRK